MRLLIKLDGFSFYCILFGACRRDQKSKRNTTQKEFYDYFFMLLFNCVAQNLCRAPQPPLPPHGKTCVKTDENKLTSSSMCDQMEYIKVRCLALTSIHATFLVKMSIKENCSFFFAQQIFNLIATNFCTIHKLNRGQLFLLLLY